MTWHMDLTFENVQQKPHSHTHNLSSRPKPKRSLIKVHDDFIKSLSMPWC